MLWKAKSQKNHSITVGRCYNDSGISASAVWEFVGYDTTMPPTYAKIFNEKINGSYTSKVKTEPVAEEDVLWKTEGFEFDYPHAGYERLYLEGNA